MGIVPERKSADDYDNDMIAARKAGIDAFALNIGTEDYAAVQLGFAYHSAAKNGMSCFISFDFAYWQPDQALDIARLISNYAILPAQLNIGGKPFVSTFAGDGLDLTTVRNAVRSRKGLDIFVLPNFRAENLGGADGLFNWLAWPDNLQNSPPGYGTPKPVSQGDDEYKRTLAGRPYMAPVSPWFSTHFGLEVPYSKNWVFPSDLLWYERWNQVLTLGAQYLEILSWNDYGESHYVGPLSSPHTDDGSSKWAIDMPHNGWLEMAKPFIKAFRAGATKPNAYVLEEKLIYWYRQTYKGAACDSTDTCKPWPNGSPPQVYAAGRPIGWDAMTDRVFVVALLKRPADIVVTSGCNCRSFSAPVGASAWSVPMNAGPQIFAIQRDGQTVMEETSMKDIMAQCTNGMYNFNAYVGTVPASPPDNLQGSGLSKFLAGMDGRC